MTIGEVGRSASSAAGWEVACGRRAEARGAASASVATCEGLFSGKRYLREKWHLPERGFYYGRIIYEKDRAFPDTAADDQCAARGYVRGAWVYVDQDREYHEGVTGGLSGDIRGSDVRSG